MLDEIFTIKNIVVYLLIVNLITFFAMFIDKKRAIKQKTRIPERTLFTLAFLGGVIGGIIGMYTFRHKTKKTKFVIGFPLILILEVFVSILVWF